jgi:hypothetical protein
MEVYIIIISHGQRTGSQKWTKVKEWVKKQTEN